MSLRSPHSPSRIHRADAKTGLKGRVHGRIFHTRHKHGKHDLGCANASPPSTITAKGILMANNNFRGAIPSARHRLAGAQPHSIIGVTPPQVIYAPNQLSFWGNNRFGDCVTAEEAFAKACSKPTILISESEAIQWATQNSFLGGAVLIDVLDLMQASGFQQNGQTYDDGPNTSVDWTNAAMLRNAIAQGPVKLGVAADQLDAVWENHPTNGWLATGFVPDSAEDHCVSLCGYGSFSWLAGQLGVAVPASVNGETQGYAMFTWDSIGIIDHLSMVAITHEAWLRNPTTLTR